MKKITDIRGELLEGCIWDQESQTLYFIDIEGKKIYALWESGKELEKIDVPEPVGCIVLEKEGTLIAALSDGLYRIDFQQKTADKVMGRILENGIRFNDGKCDDRGRLWVGSMAVCQDENAYGKGALYCIQEESVIQMYCGYTIPNGMDFERQRGYFYHIDTEEEKVERYVMGQNGELACRTVVIDLQRERGRPDGMCMDAEGNLWIAMWGGGQVICIDPYKGKVIERIQTPDICPSCCVFGGKDMDELFITTARDDEGKGGEVYMKKMSVKGRRSNHYGTEKN